MAKSNAKITRRDGNGVNQWELTAVLENGEKVSGFGITPAAAKRAFDDAKAESLAFNPA